MKILIVEDEKIAAKRLRMMINRLMPEAVIDKADSVKSAVRWLKAEDPDLLFLDIQLADGLSFEIFKRVSVSAPVIFTTAYDQYAVRAFKVNSIDYLLKPINNQELTNAIDKFLRINGSQKTNLPSVEAVLKAFEMIKGKEYRDRFAIKVGEHIILVDVSEIQYFESREKATFAKVTNGRKYLVDYSLDQLEEELNPHKFFRINRQYLIAIDFIEDIIVWSSNRLRVRMMEDNDESEFVVARERVNDFKQWLDSKI